MEVNFCSRQIAKGLYNSTVYKKQVLRFFSHDLRAYYLYSCWWRNGFEKESAWWRQARAIEMGNILVLTNNRAGLVIMRNIKHKTYGLFSIDSKSIKAQENKERKSNNHSSAISIFQTSPARTELLGIGIIY